MQLDLPKPMEVRARATAGHGPAFERVLKRLHSAALA